MINNIRNFSALKKTKELLANWWNIDLLIAIKKEGRLFYENPKSFNNPIVKELLNSPVFKRHFMNSLSDQIHRKSKTLEASQTVLWKQTGMELLVLPLIFPKQYPAPYFKVFVIAVGKIPKTTKKLKSALSYIGLANKMIEQKIKALKKISSKDFLYIQKLLQIMADEFKLYFKPIVKEETSKKTVSVLPSYGYMQGHSPAMQYIFNVLKKLKNYDGSILIEGEPGTGKRLLAKTIHLESIRSHKIFHVQNFSIFKGQFLESTLFANHSKTPKALNHKKSLVEKLNGGTLLINEIGNTSLEFQKQLLNFLKSSLFFSEGLLKNKKYNVRIISSTSHDLKQQVQKGEFLENLYFAINTMSIKIPPLRYRKTDIPLLLSYFLNKKRRDKSLKISSQALNLLYHYSWPGNIQELENEIKQLLSLKKRDQHLFTEKDLSPAIQDYSAKWNSILSENKNKNLKQTLHLVEKQILLDCLRKNNWNKSRVSQILGISRTSLIAKTKEYKLNKSKKVA